MEHLENFNEHQKRKFKSFQHEKQAERDKLEEEEKKKSWGSNYSTSYGYGWHDDRSRWRDDYKPVSYSSSSKKIVFSTEKGGEWKSAGTWIGNVVPSASDDIVICGPVYLDKSLSYRSCHDLKINKNKMLIISSTVVLNVSNDLTNNGIIRLEDGSSKEGKIHFTSLLVSGLALSGVDSDIKVGKYSIFKTKNRTVTTHDEEIKSARVAVSSQDDSKNKNNGTVSDDKLKLEHSYALQELFPTLNIDKFSTWAICTSRVLPGLVHNKDYEIYINSGGVPVDNITVKNENGIRCSYKSSWFRLYKKFPRDINAYVTPNEEYGDVIVETENGRKITSLGYNLTRGKSYRIIGLTYKGINDSQYEIIDDNSNRKSYSKLFFDLPFRLEAEKQSNGTNITKKVYSKTQLEKNKTQQPPPIPKNEPKTKTDIIPKGMKECPECHEPFKPEGYENFCSAACAIKYASDESHKRYLRGNKKENKDNDSGYDFGGDTVVPF